MSPPSASAPDALRVSTERRPGSRIRLRVEVPAEEVEAHRRRAAAAVAQAAAIPGFRPGKAPAAMIEERYRETIDKETIDDVVPRALGRALEREGLEPHWYGELSHPPLARNASLALEIEVEIRPEVEPAGYGKLRVRKRRAAVADADVAAAVEEMRERNAEWVAVDRAAAAGDLALVDYEGSVEGAPLPGGKTENLPILIGAGGTLPGFDEALAGARAGETRDFNVRVPADHPDERTRGKEISFHASVRAVKEKRLPALDEEFARSAGAESLEALRRGVAERIREVRDADAEAEIEEQILEALVAGHPLPDLPTSMVEEEADRQILRLFRRLQSAGMPPAAWMERRGIDAEGLRREFRPRAEKAVHAFLVAAAIARKEEIRVTDEEVSQRLAQIAAARREDPRKFARRLAEEGKVRRLREEMIVEKVLGRLRETAEVEEYDAPAEPLPGGEKEETT